MNPSIVPHPDQCGMSGGAVRFVMSLRAVGEGHISSIAFREGIASPTAASRCGRRARSRPRSTSTTPACSDSDAGVIVHRHPEFEPSATR